MISAVFRRGGDVSFVVEELQAVFDPQGGQWMDGRYVPSLLAAIGDIIERHLVRTGFMQDRRLTVSSASPADHAPAMRGTDGLAPTVPAPAPDAVAPATRPQTGARRCPRCHSGALIQQSGCWICRDCGYAKCG